MMSFAQWGHALYSGEKSYAIVPKRRVFVNLALGVMAVCFLLMAVFGLNRSFEFTGGSQFTLTGTTSTSQQAAYDAVAKTGAASEVRVSSVGVDGIRVQTESLNSEQTAQVRQALAQAYSVDAADVQSSSIGPSWGKDVTTKAAQSLVIFLALVALLMAIYFRSWTMSAAAIFALFHDIALTVGFFAIVRVEISPATVIGFLTILGYSLYDTVVVFDKVRELTKDLNEQRRYTYAELVNLAVNQTMVRSLNTSIVALLPVGSILLIGSFLLGAGTLTDISLALFVGMIVGTYSSIFIASPLLVILEERRAVTREHNDLVVKARLKAGHDADHISDVRVAPVQAGHRLANTAQPKRKKPRR